MPRHSTTGARCTIHGRQGQGDDRLQRGHPAGSERRPGAGTARSVVYAGSGDLDGAIIDASEAIRLNPKFAEAYYCRGAAYSTKGEYGKAIADFNAALALNPESPKTYRERGKIYGLNGDTDREIADYSAAIRLDPTDAWSFLHPRHGPRKEARVGPGDCRRRQSDPAEPPLRRGLLLPRHGPLRRKTQPSKAIADFNEAIRFQPQFAQPYYLRGLAYQRKGDKDKAAEDLARAKELGYQAE